MGFRVLLIAVKGKQPDTIHREYGVVPTGDREEFPESAVVGAMLPDGAYLLYVRDKIIPDTDVFCRLSSGASLVACYANETNMNSYASSWVNGVERWSVFHDAAQQGTKHLEANGDLPDELDSIQRAQFAAQDERGGCDYIFDIPIELFRSLGGIRYDDDIEGAGSNPWEILRRCE
jgi:hypothetical protein